MNGVQEGMEWLDEREDGAGGMTEVVFDAPVNPWGLTWMTRSSRSDSLPSG